MEFTAHSLIRVMREMPAAINELWMVGMCDTNVLKNRPKNIFGWQLRRVVDLQRCFRIWRKTLIKMDKTSQRWDLPTQIP